MDDLTAELGAELANPVLAEMLMAETLGRQARPDSDCSPRHGAEGARSARVACRWLRAVALERPGKPRRPNRNCWPRNPWTRTRRPLFDLARFASDRGDAEQGLSLLRRAGAPPDDPMVELLERHRASRGRTSAATRRAGAGRAASTRNATSAANSCHWPSGPVGFTARPASTPSWPVEDLLTRSQTSAASNDEDGEFDGWRPTGGGRGDVRGRCVRGLRAVRGSLLPEDERALAEQWLLIDRSVFEVEEVRRGQGMTVRDVRTGDRHEVRERTGSGRLKPGQLICARVVPAGDTMQIFGGIEPVALHERDA